MKLDAIIDLDSLQQIQDTFTKATGLAAIAVNYQGEPLIRYSSFTPFCSKLREHPKYYEKCRQSDAHSSLESARAGKICIHRCHAGLIDFAIPIIVEGEYVASMLAGQTKVDTYDNDLINKDLIKLSEDIFIDAPELKEYFDSIPVLPFNRIYEAANLMYLILNHTIEQYLANKRTLALLEEQKKKVELEEQYNNLEIRLHHSQVTPHFLFNALNVAGRQAYLEGAQKTQDIIYALADMYRYSMNYAGLLIPVEQEVQNLRNYLFIQTIRFGNLLKLHIDIDDSIMEYIVPAMGLQIFVENSIRHGLEKKENMGTVEIIGYKRNGRLRFEITDNGVGMPADRIKLLNEPNFVGNPSLKLAGIGIYNVHKRLQYFFHDDYSVLFSAVPEGGVMVEIAIPAKTVSQVNMVS